MQQCSEKGLEHLDRISSKNKKMPDTGLITATIVPSQRKKKKIKNTAYLEQAGNKSKNPKSKKLVLHFSAKEGSLIQSVYSYLLIF